MMKRVAEVTGVEIFKIYSWTRRSVAGLGPAFGCRVRPKLHRYTGYKRTAFVAPGSMELVMGHLLHSEAAP